MGKSLSTWKWLHVCDRAAHLNYKTTSGCNEQWWEMREQLSPQCIKQNCAWEDNNRSTLNAFLASHLVCRTDAVNEMLWKVLCIFTLHWTYVINDGVQSLMLVSPSAHCSPADGFSSTYRMVKCCTSLSQHCSRISRSGFAEYLFLNNCSTHKERHLFLRKQEKSSYLEKNKSLRKTCQETLLSTQEGKQIILILVFLFVT